MENKDLIIIGLLGIILLGMIFGGFRSGGYGCPMVSLGYGGGYGIMLIWIVVIVALVYFTVRYFSNSNVLDNNRGRRK